MIAPPVFVVGERDLHAFATLHDLARGLRPIEAREPGTRAYDSLGRRLELDVERRPETVRRLGRRRERELVVARAIEDQPAHAAPLAEALRRALAPYGGIPADASREVPLSTLVRMSLERFAIPA